MLVALAIRDIVIIEKLAIDFTPGLTVLTGETGAGKSILLDSLSLALGGRGDAALVRAGAEQGDVTAVFSAADFASALVFSASGLLPQPATASSDMMAKTSHALPVFFIMML